MESISVIARPVTNAAASAAGAVRRAAGRLFGDDGFNFKDVLDLVNPLQHIPVVGNVYRKLTGDVLAPAMRVAGGALFGGPLGAGLSLVGLAVEEGAQQGAAAAAAAETAVEPAVAANAASAHVPRGGWMIAAAVQGGALPGFVPEDVVASNAAVALAESGVAQGSPDAPPRSDTQVQPPPAAQAARELHLPARRAMLPPPLPAPPAAEPLAGMPPRGGWMDAQAIASFAAWQALADPAPTRFVEHA